MEIEIIKSVKEKVSIEFPYYSKDSVSVYKIISKDEVIKVDYAKFCSGVQFMDFIPSHSIEASPIEEEEFIKTYFNVLKVLNNYITII